MWTEEEERDDKEYDSNRGKTMMTMSVCHCGVEKEDSTFKY